MLFWIALAWVALSIATAAAFHIMRRRYKPVAIPREVRSFLRELEEIVRAHHPEVAIRGMLPGRFTIVFEVQGQEVPVPLHQLFRHASTFPEAMPQMVETLMREIRTGGLTRVSDHAFEDVATRILPQVRGAAWVQERGAAFGDAALVTRELNDDLRVCYVIDDAWSMVFVCRAHLRQWGIDAESVHHLALQNLRRSSLGTLPLPKSGEEAVVVRTGDGYDAARVLLLDPEQAEGLLVAMPERDTLWLGSAPGEPMSSLMDLNRAQSEHAQYPVSANLYRMHDGHLEPVDETRA